MNEEQIRKIKLFLNSKSSFTLVKDHSYGIVVEGIFDFLYHLKKGILMILGLPFLVVYYVMRIILSLLFVVIYKTTNKFSVKLYLAMYFLKHGKTLERGNK